MQRFNVQTRTAIEKNKLSGHSAVFGQVADIGPRGYEQIAPEAFNDVLTRSDARFLVNHDPSQLLGRQSSGTLRMSPDSKGLYFEVDLPNTQLGNDIRELVERGDMDQGSFGFIPGEDVIQRTKDGRQLRTHTAIKELLDLSIVTYPAYEGTEVSLRSMQIETEPSFIEARLLRAKILAHQINALGGV